MQPCTCISALQFYVSRFIHLYIVRAEIDQLKDEAQTKGRELEKASKVREEVCVHGTAVPGYLPCVHVQCHI